MLLKTANSISLINWQHLEGFNQPLWRIIESFYELPSCCLSKGQWCLSIACWEIWRCFWKNHFILIFWRKSVKSLSFHFEALQDSRQIGFFGLSSLTWMTIRIIGATSRRICKEFQHILISNKFISYIKWYENDWVCKVWTKVCLIELICYKPLSQVLHDNKPLGCKICFVQCRIYNWKFINW